MTISTKSVASCSIRVLAGLGSKIVILTPRCRHTRNTRSAPKRNSLSLCKSSRAANLAMVTGQAVALSAVECLKLRKANLESDIESLTGSDKRINKELDELASGKIGKRIEKRIARLATDLKRVRKTRARKERELTGLPTRPSVWIRGRRLYYNQPEGKDAVARAKWREAWHKARHATFGARGSSDEAGGNSTYTIQYSETRVKTTRYNGYLSASNELEFSVRHKRRIVGNFRLGEKEGVVLRDVLAANHGELILGNDGEVKVAKTPIKVEFERRKSGKSGEGWNVRLTMPMPVKKPCYEIDAAMGVDVNNGNFPSMLVHAEGKGLIGFRLGRYQNNLYNVDAPREDKKRVISEQIRKIVYEARENRAVLVLEALDFEGAKRTLRNKLGATLHGMPYKAIRDKFIRECAKQGVPIRFVNPRYTSLLGNLLATLDPKLSRDVAAAGVIALFGLPMGREYLMAKLSDTDRDRIRINSKGQFGRHVYGWGGCQMDNPSSKPDTAATEEPRAMPRKPTWLETGALIKNIATEMVKSGKSRMAGRTVCRIVEDARATDAPGGKKKRVKKLKAQKVFQVQLVRAPLFLKSEDLSKCSSLINSG